MEDNRVVGSKQRNASSNFKYMEFIWFAGNGSLGNVKLMQDRQTKIIVAVKEIANQAIKDSNIYSFCGTLYEERIRTEHPNILKVYGVFFQSNTWYVMEEFAPHGNLQALLYTMRKLEMPKTRRIIRSIINALTFCHDRCIHHCELTPKNILIGYNGIIKLASPGLNNKGPDYTCFGHECDRFVGTLGYTKPTVYEVAKESRTHWPNSLDHQLWADKKVNHKDGDSFNIGILIYYMLSGKHPFMDSPNTDETTVISRMRECSDNLGFINLPDEIKCDPYLRYMVPSLLDTKSPMKFDNLTKSFWVNYLPTKQNQKLNTGYMRISLPDYDSKCDK